MFYLYGDISGTKNDSVMVTAAYLGPERRWAAADKDWGRALREAKVDEFHATDFFACRGAFEGWKLNSKRHIATAKRFTAIAPRHRLIGFVYAIEVASFMEIARPALSKSGPKQFRSISPRLFCANGCLSKVAIALKRYHHLIPSGERVAVFLEREKGIGEVVDWFDYCKRRHERWTNLIISIAAVDRRVRPVQMADLLAHEAWRRAKDHLAKTGRLQRKSLEALVSGPPVDAQIATAKSFREMIERLRVFVAQRDADRA